MKKKLTPVITVFILIFLVLCAGGITFLVKRYMPSGDKMDSREYFQLENENEAALIVDNDLKEEKVLMLDGRYYIADSAVGKYINSRFYWDANQKAMIYTLPKEAFMIQPEMKAYVTGEGTYMMDYVILREYQGAYYLDMEFIRKFTDMDYKVYEDPSRVVIQTQWPSVQKVKALKDTEIRVKGGIKSTIVDTVKKGEELILGEQMEDWSKVSTEDGYTGYLKNKKISQPVTTEEEIRTEKQIEYTSLTRDHKINLAWHQVTSMDGNDLLASVMEGVTGLNTISPTWFSVIDNNGTISSLASAAYVEQAHGMGLEVWGLIDNFNKDADTLTFLSDTMVRGHIIEQLLSEAVRVGLDGINLDFESITEEQGPHYVQFIRELSIACRNNGLVFSIDNPVPMPYTSHYDRKEQGTVADYVIIMGYDEHFSGSEEAGSVASLGYVKDGIEGTLKDVPANKIINGIPFYTRVWKEPYGGGNVTSEVLGMDGTSSYIAEHGMETFWDEQTGQTMAYLEGEDGIYSIWVEDETSIEEKMKLIRQYGLGGVAAWKLGFQRNTIWPVITQYLQ